MVTNEFLTITDLYKKVLPALKIKRKEFARDKILFIKEQDIWTYLKINKWQKDTNLTLYDIVSDILNVKLDDILLYVKNR